MRIAEGDCARICRSLSLLLHAGVSLSEGVFLLAEESGRSIRDVMQKLGEGMDAGMSLSEAMEDSGAFPRHMTGMIRVGEESGRSEETLESLAVFYEERERMSRQVRSALTYPSMLLLLMLVVIAVLLVKVLPVFDEVYQSLGSRLTGIGAGLMAAGRLLETALPVLLAILALAVVAVLAYSVCPLVREKVSAWARRAFGDRGVMKKFNNAHFVRALSIGLSSGLPLEDSAGLARRLLEDVPGASERCSRCAEAMFAEEDLSKAMQAAELLSPAQCRMLVVGVRGGNADRMMETIADELMQDATGSLERMVAKIEPTMVLVTSLLVGVILLSVMLPLMNIMNVIG